VFAIGYFRANFHGIGGKGHTMRVFGYLGIGFVIVWLLAPAPMAITSAETVVQVPSATQSPSQPTSSVEEDDLLSTLD
jgi:hypothetical protein